MQYLCFFIFIFVLNKVFGQFVGVKNPDEISTIKQPIKLAAGEIRKSKNCQASKKRIIDTITPNYYNYKLDPTKSPKRIKRRAVPDTLYMEVFIVIDEKLSEAIGKSYSNGYWNKYGQNRALPPGIPSKEKELYLRKFMTAVNARFEDQFKSPKIKLHISGILEGKDLSFSKTAKDDEDTMDIWNTLEKMPPYFNETFRQKSNFDVILFLTGKHKMCKTDIWRWCGKEKYKGMSFQNGACYDIPVNWEPDLSFGMAIVSDLGAFSGVNTAVHEIGHLLGANEDGIKNDCCSSNGYIMTDLTTANRFLKRNSAKWSSCSVTAINNFLNSDQAAMCLYNKPKLDWHPLLDYEDLIAPNVPSLVDQCSVMVKANGRQALKSVLGFCGSDPCQVLMCETKITCMDFLPAMEGSRCLDGKTCYKGECVDKDATTSIKWPICVDTGKHTRWKGVIKLGEYASIWDCLDSCRTFNTTVCEWTVEAGQCHGHVKKVEEVNGAKHSLCYVIGSGGGEGTTTKSPGKKTTKKYEKTTTKKKLTTWTTAIPFPKENRLVDCPPGWKKHKKHCYKFMMENVGDLNFDSSEQYCIDLVQDMNANIVQIDNRKQQNWIELQIKRTRKQAKSKRKLEPFYISRPFDLDTNKKRYLNFYTGSKRYKIHKGQCLDANNETQVDGIINMGKASNKDDCMRTCDMFISTYGCEYDIKNRDCRAIHGELKSGDYTANHLCFIWSSQHGTETELAEKSVRVLSQTRQDYNYWLNDTENICMAAVFDPKLGDAPWRYALCTQPMENIMCMFKQRTSDAFCTISDAPWDKDPHKQKGFYSCEEKKDTQYFCHNSDEYGYCALKRQQIPYENEKLCGMACRQYTYSRKGFQCIYYIFEKARKTCTFMVVCEKLFKLDICEDTAAKGYVSGKCFQQNNDYTHVVKVDINQDIDRCKWLDPPVGKWFIGDCKAKGRKKVTRGTIDLGTDINQHLCLERCNLEGRAGALTGCNYDKVTNACKGHTESVKSGNGVGTARCFVFKQHTNRKRGGSTTEPLTKGPFQKIWTDEQCPNLERGPHKGNLADCKYACEDHSDCNAINFNAGFGDDYAECVLRACPVPIPKPTWKYKKYKGYSS